MATTSTNLGLTLPALSERLSLTVLNQNWNLIDAFAGNVNCVRLTSGTNFTTILSVINNYRSAKTYPFTIQKSGSVAFTDLPSGVTNTCEWNALVVGDQTRSTVIFTPYTGASSKNQMIWVQNYYNGAVNQSWQQIITSNAQDWYSRTTVWLAERERSDGAAACMIQLFGKMAVLSITTSSRAHAEDDVLGTIESGFRPLIATYGPCYAGGQAGWIRITTDGEIKIWLLPSGTAASRIYTTIPFVIA